MNFRRFEFILINFFVSCRTLSSLFAMCLGVCVCVYVYTNFLIMYNIEIVRCCKQCSAWIF